MIYQKTLKITNKAILKIDQMNVTNVLTTDYNRLDTWYRGKNKAISKPIFFQFPLSKYVLDFTRLRRAYLPKAISYHPEGCLGDAHPAGKKDHLTNVVIC
jgi:hypothetical protein